jgi:hypothetical protein
MGVGVSVGVIVGVEVSVGVSVCVGVAVGEGVNVIVGVKVGEGVCVLVRVAVGLMKKARTEGFEVNNQADITRIPSPKLNAQKLTTSCFKDFDDDGDITLPPARFGAANPGPY